MLRSTLRLITLAALSAAAAPLAAQAATPTEAVQRFFAAAADTNLKAMGSLWGTAKGPAAKENVPADWERRMMVMGTFLVGTTARTLGELDAKDPNTRTVTTEIARGNCKVTLTVGTVKSSAGWLVNKFDLGQVGNVNRGVCDGGNPVRH